MKIGIIATMIFASMQSIAGLREIRNAYFRSSISQAEALRLEHLLDSVSENAAPVLICYKGAAVMLKARYAINPLAKLSCFKRGKTLIEAGLAKDTGCLESRFIRFSVQNNLPRFLSYNQNIMQDSLFITKGMTDIKDFDLKYKIMDYFQRTKTVNKK